MSIEEIDDLFAYLHGKAEVYTKWRDIVTEFAKGKESVDVEGMLIKMHKDGYLDSGAVKDNDVIIGYRQQGIYKLSFEGRMAFEKTLLKKYKSCEGRPYKLGQKQQIQNQSWIRAKTIAAVSNALIIISIAVIGLFISSKAATQETELKRAKYLVDSLTNYINMHLKR